MDRIDFLPQPWPASAQERRRSRRRITALVVLALIVACGLVAAAFLVPGAGRAGHAVARHADETLRPSEIGLGRSTIRRRDETVF
jgi:hypothetical protein